MMKKTFLFTLLFAGLTVCSQHAAPRVLSGKYKLTQKRYQQLKGIKEIACGGGKVWAVCHNGGIHEYLKQYESGHSFHSWVKRGERGNKISVSTKGSVAMCTKDDKALHTWNGWAWPRTPASYVQDVAFGKKQATVVGARKQIYLHNGGASWTALLKKSPGHFTEVAGNHPNNLYGISKGRIYKFHKGGWIRYSSKLNRITNISVKGRYVCACDSNKNIYVNGRRIATGFKNVSINKKGNIWAIGTNNKVYFIKRK